MFRKIIKGLKDVWCGTLEFDTEPKKGSFNPVTSGGVYEAINGAGGAKEIVYFDIDPSDPPSGIYEAIGEALSNNKEPVIKNDGTVYFYSSTSTDKYIFVGGYNTEVVNYKTVTVSDDDSVVMETVDTIEGMVFPLYYHSENEQFTVADKTGHALTKTEIADAYRAGQIFMFSSYPASNQQAHWGYCCNIDIDSDNTGYAEFFILAAFGGDSYEWEKYRINLSSGTEFVTLWGPNTSYSTGYSGYYADGATTVSVSTTQNFNSTQKAKGRDNIGAASASDVTALQSQVSSLSDVSAYSVKGEATVSQLNAGPSGIQAGWAYQLTDSGTLTDGSLAVVAGDTVAWDGTKWFPLVKSDYYATKTYAQNVAHSIAPEFDPTRTSENPYKVGETVMYTDGKTYTFKVNHYGAWNAADVYAETGVYAFTEACSKSNVIVGGRVSCVERKGVRYNDDGTFVFFSSKKRICNIEPIKKEFSSVTIADGYEANIYEYDSNGEHLTNKFRVSGYVSLGVGNQGGDLYIVVVKISNNEEIDVLPEEFSAAVKFNVVNSNGVRFINGTLNNGALTDAAHVIVSDLIAISDKFKLTVSEGYRFLVAFYKNGVFVSNAGFFTSTMCLCPDFEFDSIRILISKSPSDLTDKITYDKMLLYVSKVQMSDYDAGEYIFSNTKISVGGAYSFSTNRASSGFVKVQKGDSFFVNQSGYSINAAYYDNGYNYISNGESFSNKVFASSDGYMRLLISKSGDEDFSADVAANLVEKGSVFVHVYDNDTPEEVRISLGRWRTGSYTYNGEDVTGRAYIIMSDLVEFDENVYVDIADGYRYIVRKYDKNLGTFVKESEWYDHSSVIVDWDKYKYVFYVSKNPSDDTDVIYGTKIKLYADKLSLKVKAFSVDEISFFDKVGLYSSTDLSAATHIPVSDVYARFDALVAAYPEYVFKNDLGIDTSGDYHIYEYRFVPKTLGKYNENFAPETENEVKMPLVLVTGAIHGNETWGAMTVLNFFEKLCTSGNGYFSFFRKNFEFSVIPLANPWGWANNTRTNSAGQDINRLFCRTDSALQGIADEVILLRNWISQKGKSACAFVDCHIAWNGKDRDVAWLISKCGIFNQDAQCIISFLSDLWRSKYPIITYQGLMGYVGDSTYINTTAGFPALRDYAFTQCHNCMTLEFPGRLLYEGQTGGSPMLMNMYMDFFSGVMSALAMRAGANLS